MESLILFVNVQSTQNKNCYETKSHKMEQQESQQVHPIHNQKVIFSRPFE